MTTKRTSKTNTRNTTTQTGAQAAAWLRASSNGRTRVAVLGWMALAGLWVGHRPGSTVRRLIAAECRRCGYTPTNILALNAR